MGIPSVWVNLHQDNTITLGRTNEISMSAGAGDTKHGGRMSSKLFTMTNTV